MASVTGQHAHITPVWHYLVVYVILLVLLVATYAVYTFHLGAVMAILVAMGIALVKAFLVVVVFMQVGSGSKLIKVWAALGFIWLILLSGIIVDYIARGYRMQDGKNFSPAIVSILK